MSSAVVSVPEEDPVVIKYIPSDSSVSVEAQVVVIHPENVQNTQEVRHSGQKCQKYHPFSPFIP